MVNARGHAQSDVGKARKANEDSFLVNEALGLYIVADGMGGHAAGDIASQNTVSIIESYLLKNRSLIDDFKGSASERDEIVGLVRRAIQKASYEVHQLATRQSGRAGMGTTCTLLLVLRDKGILGHVGDSRLYLKRAERFDQLSDDHSYVQQLIRRGLLSVEEAERSPYANVITRAVGIHAQVEVDTLVFDLLPGDVVLLCSDGLTKHVPHEKDLSELIDATLNEQAPIESLARLTQAALDDGGTDNVTSLLVYCDGQGDGQTQTPDEQTRQTEVSLRVQTLQDISLFYFLGMRELLSVVDIIEEVNVDKNEEVVRFGSSSDEMYIVLEGEVLVKTPDKTLASLGRGAHFGEMGLLSARPRTATVSATVKSKLLRISRNSFNELVRREPGLGVKLLWAISQSIAERLEVANRGHSAQPTVTENDLPFALSDSSRFPRIDKDEAETIRNFPVPTPYSDEKS